MNPVMLPPFYYGASSHVLRLTHFGVSGSSRERHIAGWSHYLKRLELVAVGTDPGPDPYATLDTAHG
jgi:hypothetical protein